MRIAAIYDIHGNAPALESVIEDVAAEQVDHFVIGGDVVSGPMPYGERGAHWLMIDSDVQFRCTLYDFEKAANRVRTTGYPDAEEFAERTILRPHSEAAVLDVFEPRALGES